jgi:alginate O-acetyltransferase complex protein AlgI
LYIPLGGNRKGTGRTYFNLLVTMLLCGLWHGASWSFVLWGAIHGISLAVHRLWKAWEPFKAYEESPVFQMAWTVVSRFLTLGIVLVGWVFFRAKSLPVAADYLSRMFSWTHQGVHLVSPYIIPAFILVVVVHFVVQKDRNWAQEVPQKGVALRLAAYSCMAILLCLFAATDAAPFIYFQF